MPKRKVISIGHAGQRIVEAAILFSGGKVSVQCDLHAEDGRRVVHVSIVANGDCYASAGELPWFIANDAEVAKDRTGVGIRIVEGEPTK